MFCICEFKEAFSLKIRGLKKHFPMPYQSIILFFSTKFPRFFVRKERTDEGFGFFINKFMRWPFV